MNVHSFKGGARFDIHAVCDIEGKVAGKKLDVGIKGWEATRREVTPRSLQLGTYPVTKGKPVDLHERPRAFTIHAHEPERQMPVSCFMYHIRWT